MSFAGHGFVVVQPSEELPISSIAGSGSGQQSGHGDQGLGGLIGGLLGGR